MNMSKARTAENVGTGLYDVRRYIIADSGKRVEITGCFWCGNREHICQPCAAKARDIWLHEYDDTRTGETVYMCGDVLGQLYSSIFKHKRDEYLATYRQLNLSVQP